MWNTSEQEELFEVDGGWKNIFIILFKGRKSLQKDAWLCGGSTEFVQEGLFCSLLCSVKASCVCFSGFVCAVVLFNTDLLTHVRSPLKNNEIPYNEFSTHLSVFKISEYLCGSDPSRLLLSVTVLR